MERKSLMVIFALAVLLIAGLMTAPVFSGEHPWDSDKPAPNHAPVTGHIQDTTSAGLDSTGVVMNGGTTVATVIRWHRIVRAAWSASLAW